MSQPRAPSIDQLQELPLPVPPFSYLPQTWAWLLLLLVLLALAALWGVWRWRQWQRDRYRREALQRLAVLGRALERPQERLPALRELPELLKRVVLSMPDAPAAHALGGAAWQALLQRYSTRPLPAGFADSLFTLAYAPDQHVLAMPTEHTEALYRSCREWVEVHRVAV